MQKAPPDILLTDDVPHFTVTLTCPYCRAKGEPSEVVFVQGASWTENDKTVVIPTICETCCTSHAFELRLP